MSKEPNTPASKQGIPDATTDPLYDRLLAMFLRRDVAALSNIDDIDLAELRETLTESERKAVESLGSSEELVAKIAARASDLTTGGVQAGMTTTCESLETVAARARRADAANVAETFDAINENLAAFRRQEQFDFSFSCRRVAELGRGGQGVVYRVEGIDEFSAVRALKVFSPRSPDDVRMFLGDMERIKSIASLIQHGPHDAVVDVSWFGEYQGVYAMVMQCIDGFDLQRLLQPGLLENLRERVTEQRWRTINNVVYSANGCQQLALQPAIAVYIIERVLRGLEAMHKKGIVHGDIKPSNIMLNGSGSVKIIDIGSAFQVSAQPAYHHFTPAYAAPEFLTTGEMSMQSDLASVGYMLVELLSGKSLAEGLCDPDQSTTAFAGFDRDALLEARRTLPVRLGEYLPPQVMKSHQLVELCRHLIDPDLKQRFPTAADSILNHIGTYQFNSDLIRCDLGVCNFYEVSQWLEDVKSAISTE